MYKVFREVVRRRRQYRDMALQNVSKVEDGGKTDITFTCSCDVGSADGKLDLLRNARSASQLL